MPSFPRLLRRSDDRLGKSSEINLLSAKQISTVPNLQRHLQRHDVDVQTTLQRCVMALNAPMKLAHWMF